MSRQPTHHGYAVNVKDYSLYDPIEPLSEEDAQAIYEDVAEEFWSGAAVIARGHGFRDVYSAGRMNGWCVPQPQPSEHSIGPTIEYVPDLAAWERERFRPFEAAILTWLEECRDLYTAGLAEAVKRAKAEPAEAAYWAACDVVTVA